MSDFESTPDTEPAADTDHNDALPNDEAAEIIEEGKNTDDAGQAEAQARMDVATERGYLGNKVDPLPNEAHSLESGPDAPTIDPDTRA